MTASRVARDIEQVVEACYGSTFALDGSWISLPGAVIPSQGWKLHVSATLPDALPVLGRALPLLRAENVTAKVAGSLAMLAELNEGWLGPSQIGKLLTVYPVDDHQAIALADRLDAAATGYRGPSVPSDRPLHPGQPGALSIRRLRRPADADTARRARGRDPTAGRRAGT